MKTSSGRPHSRRHSAISSEVSGVRLARLQHRRVAGGERRDAVAEGVGERVVPRADHADHARPARSGPRACGPSRTGELERILSSARYFGGVLGPEAERGGRVAHLGQLGVLVGLAGLGDDRARRSGRSCRAPTSARAAGCGARPSKPSASQPGCAARARADHLGHVGRLSAGTEAMTSPVAGLCTSIVWLCPLVRWSAASPSTVVSDTVPPRLLGSSMGYRDGVGSPSPRRRSRPALPFERPRRRSASSSLMYG